MTNDEWLITVIKKKIHDWIMSSTSAANDNRQ